MGEEKEKESPDRRKTNREKEGGIKCQVLQNNQEGWAMSETIWLQKVPENLLQSTLRSKLVKKSDFCELKDGVSCIFFKLINLFIFGCVGSSFLCEGFL